MSFKKIITIKKEIGRDKKICEFECDQCGKIYTRGYVKKYTNINNLTFCSIECKGISSRKDGKIQEKSKKTSIEKYGVEYASQTEDFQNKRKKSCLERYGIEHHLKSDKIKEKRKNTCLEKYGVEHVLQLKHVKEKSKETCFKRYGADNASKSVEVQDRRKKTCLEKYGVDHQWKSCHIRKKCTNTLFEKLGVLHQMESEEIKEKIKRTNTEKYGVEYGLKSSQIRSKIDWCDVSKKRHLSMKKNGSYGKSKIEDTFHEYLCAIFCENNVSRQERINGWSIDFYVKSINMYIQFDGTYWHGLDRPIEVIKEFKHPRDKVIYETYLRDQEQNEWFKENDKILIRITDKEFKKILKE